MQRRRRLEQDRDLMLSLDEAQRRPDGPRRMGRRRARRWTPSSPRASRRSTRRSRPARSRRCWAVEHDRKNAIITIHPGAGGTESQDWAEMLLRMYLRWMERRGFKRELIDYPAGRRSGTQERHADRRPATTPTACCRRRPACIGSCGSRRSIPAARRHTSFASVYVWPELPEDVDIEIDDKDLRIDTFRSSGAGGQHVNVTDSAIRITHSADRASSCRARTSARSTATRTRR